MTATAISAPGGEIATRPLHIFFLADHSSSMSGERIEKLNYAFREVIPALMDAIQSQPQVQVYVRTIKFATNAEWSGGEDPVPLENYVWADLVADGVTATAQAIDLLTEQLEYNKMLAHGRNQYPPLCILISDGFCTDPPEDYGRAVEKLLEAPYGKRAVRLALAIGEPGEYDEEALLKFVSHKEEVGLLKAERPEEIVKYIRWATIQGSKGASMGGEALDETPAHNVILPPPPDNDDDEFAVF
jgi:uncharacterized protein YegL